VDNYAVKVAGYYLSGALISLELFTIHSLIALALQGLALPVTYQLPTSYQSPHQLAIAYLITRPGNSPAILDSSHPLPLATSYLSPLATSYRPALPVKTDPY
jgi:hypothetical protein